MQDEHTECLKDCKFAINLGYSLLKSKSPIPPLLLISRKLITDILVEALVCKAVALEEIGKFYNAIHEYTNILSLDRTLEGQITENIKQCKLALYKQHGDEYYKNGQLQEASTSYTNAINTLTPGHSDTIVFLNCRATLSRIRRAHRMLERL
jgi:tetratricopeptide (TPR) repeat protein